MRLPKARRIVIAVYEGVSLLDLPGPLERASAANKMIRERKRRAIPSWRLAPALKRHTIRRSQPDFRGLGIIPMVNHESAFGQTGHQLASAATLAR
jgi:hypothetical protein